MDTQLILEELDHARKRRLAKIPHTLTLEQKLKALVNHEFTVCVAKMNERAESFGQDPRWFDAITFNEEAEWANQRTKVEAEYLQMRAAVVTGDADSNTLYTYLSQ